MLNMTVSDGKDRYGAGYPGMRGPAFFSNLRNMGVQRSRGLRRGRQSARVPPMNEYAGIIKTLVEFLFNSICPEKFRELYRGFPRMSTRKIPGCFSHFHTITRLSLPDLISLFAIWTASRSFRFGSSTHHIAHHLQCQDILCSLVVRPCLASGWDNAIPWWGPSRLAHNFSKCRTRSGGCFVEAIQQRESDSVGCCVSPP